LTRTNVRPADALHRLRAISRCAAERPCRIGGTAATLATVPTASRTTELLYHRSARKKSTGAGLQILSFQGKQSWILFL
jgi:hypothetical protein